MGHIRVAPDIPPFPLPAPRFDQIFAEYSQHVSP
jgi:hypothetical protein